MAERSIDQPAMGAAPWPGLSPRRLLLGGALAMALWLVAAFLVHVAFASHRSIPEIFFLDQDFPALVTGALALALMAPLAGGRGFALPAPDWRSVGTIILLLMVISWVGHYGLFQNYSLSRDEEMAEFAAAYMREGMIARPIPPEWIDYRRALVPEFYSAFGAARYWASSYLPINSGIRALFARVGDENLASPALLGIGLLALWRIARRLFPDRDDVVWVVMLLAFTSMQLTITAMTAFAMTGHFAFNMVWLALVLRGGRWRHGLAGVVAILTGGMHQWHFVLIFIGPFLLWFTLQRRWHVLAFHTAICLAIIVIWAKLWPAMLIDLLGPASDIRPSAGVADKLGSLVKRATRDWMPLLYILRFVTWNNLLLLPLAAIGIVGMGWRGLIRSAMPVMPLALGCAAGCLLTTYQVYGWGYRYMHGYIGGFCLLAGYGWLRLGQTSLRPVLLACALAVPVGGFLGWRTYTYVAPYAASHRMIRASDADIVLVDPRGSVFVSDLVRGDHGNFKRPLVMNLALLDAPRLDHLCARYSVAILDRADFGRLGVPPARSRGNRVQQLRAHLAGIGCG